jgi:hypothetical protein
MMPPAGGAILDVVLEKGEGVYPIVTHSLTDALRGAIAILKVSKDAERRPLLALWNPGFQRHQPVPRGLHLNSRGCTEMKSDVF